MDIKIEISPELRELCRNPGVVMREARRSGMLNLVEDIEARAVKEAPVRSSNLVNSITSTVSPDGSEGIIKATAPYAEYVHDGTGIFGPKKQKIVPKNKKALAFKTGGKMLIRKSVKGQKPNPFFKRAVERAEAQQTFNLGMMAYLKKFGAT